jgi:hypothetical protein
MARMRSLLLVVAASLAWAGSAAAVSFYGELLTPLGGVRGTLTADFSYGDIDLSTSGLTSVDGLPNGGLVTPDAPLSYTHFFSPGVEVEAIQSACLYVALVDDAVPLADTFTPNEWATIDLDGSLWTQGQAVLNVLGGSVAISAFSQDGLLGIRVSSANDADFRIAGSLFKVKFDAAPPIPEPTAALTFGLGALVIVGALRRRLSA